MFKPEISNKANKTGKKAEKITTFLVNNNRTNKTPKKIYENLQESSNEIGITQENANKKIQLKLSSKNHLISL